MGFLFEIKELSKSFKIDENRSSSVLNDLNFNLPSSGMFFIYGKSGSGKSTLLNILEGLLKPSSGKIFYKGKDISKYNKNELHKYFKNEIGIIFQSFNLINDLTVKENLEITRLIKNKKSIDSVNSFINILDVEKLMNKKVNILSGGEKQRVAIIRSLINNPSVIFADEPTGSLDGKNSIIIMDILKEISKERLVVVVSHNKDLIEKYNDGYLDITNKHIKEIPLKETLNKEVDNETNFSSPIFPLVTKNIKKNHLRDLISFISVMFSCLVILISFGIKNGINNGINNLLKGYQNYNSFKISKIDYEIINNSSLKMQKTSLPTIEEVENITKQYENCEIKSNLDYFFSNEIDVNIAGKNFNEVKFIPVNNIKTSNVVYVNKSFKKLYESKCDGSCLNKLINVHLKREIHNNTIHTYNEGIITENFDVFLTFDIEQINTEFDYLNYPKVYFSYDFFINKLSNLEAINSTKITNKKVTFLDILNSEYNDEISDYKKLIYFDTFDDSLNFYNQFDNRIFAVESENFNTVKSFSELIQALIEGGKIFIGVAAICSILVVVFLSYYSFVFNRKESAILTSLGMEENSLIMIYILEQLLMTFFGVIFSYFLMKIIQKPLNILIYNNTYFRDLVMVNFSSKTLLLFLIFAMGLVFICLYFPLSFSKKIEISKELKEE